MDPGRLLLERLKKPAEMYRLAAKEPGQNEQKLIFVESSRVEQLFARPTSLFFAHLLKMCTL